MVIKLALTDNPATGCFVVVAVMAGDDNDSTASRARGGFDDELTAVANQLGEAAHVAPAADDGISFRHGDAVLVADLFGDRFVVDAREARSRIGLLNERQVAAIDAEHAGLFQLVGPSEQRATPDRQQAMNNVHQAASRTSTKSRNRHSSVSR